MNKTVLITGAGIRLGNVITHTLAQAGWRVIVHAHRSILQADELCESLRAAGLQASRITGDLLADGGPEAVFNVALACFSPITALVNNAAIFAHHPLISATATDFERMWRINTLAPIRLTQLLATHVSDCQTTGCVVNLLDQRIAHTAVNTIPYLLSKKSLADFTLSAARELAPAVRVNAVAPGAILLPVNIAAKEQAGEFPLGTRPTAQQTADAVRYLLDAPTVTGQILYVDSGQHLPTFFT